MKATPQANNASPFHGRHLATGVKIKVKIDKNHFLRQDKLTFDESFNPYNKQLEYIEVVGIDWGHHRCYLVRVQGKNWLIYHYCNLEDNRNWKSVWLISWLAIVILALEAINNTHGGDDTPECSLFVIVARCILSSKCTFEPSQNLDFSK